MTEHKRLADNIQTRMAFYVSNLRMSNDRDYFDENKEAEYFFCKPLSLLFDADVTNVNSEQRNFPGIDLADRKKRICFQITSTNTKDKVQHTLDKFLEHKLDDDFDRLIVLIVTQDPPPKCANLKFQRSFDFNAKRDVWNISRLVQEFADLPADKRHLLQAFSDYLDQELPNMGPQKPRLALRLSSKLQSTGFVGREAELAEIRRRFEKGDKLVVLTGLGGIGKTELATHYGQEYPGEVYFIRFDTSFTRTLANMARAIRPPLSDEALRQEESVLADMVLRMLENSGQQDLLILDNADSETGSLEDLQSDPGYGALSGLPLRLLVTTRSDAPGAIPVTPLPDEALIQIFKNYGAKLTDVEMTALIRAVNGHTMTIDLIARTLVAKTWQTVTAADILTALREHTLRYRKYRKITTHYKQSSEQAQIYTHLSVVFDVSGVPDAGKAALRCATLLPEDGMDSNCFGTALDPEAQEALYTLLDRGWLEVRDDLLTIHPVIRLVCREELQPGDDCGDFLDALWGQLDEKEYDRVKFAQLAEVFASAVEIARNKETKSRWVNRSGWLWLELRESQRAAALYEQHLPELEQQLPDHPELATAYNNVGTTYGDLGDHNKDFEYQLKALAIWERVLPKDHPDLAMSYNNVGTTYGYLGDHNRALEFKLKALAIREKVLPQNHPNLAQSYNNLGTTYGYLGNHNRALELKLKALAIREKVLPENHPDLAQSYNNLGITYGDLGDHNKALEFKLKALAIWENVLPEDHPDLAQSYNNVGYTYSHLGNHNRALEYQLKALAIREKVLPENHPDLAISYNNVGITYGHLGNHNKALEFTLKALVICERVLPQNHPDLATSYNNVGYTYGHLGDHNKELEYLLKALAIREKVLPENHTDLAASCNNIACTYYDLGQLPEAAQYMRRAADIISRSSLPEDHPDRVNYTQWAAELEQEAKTPQ